MENAFLKKSFRNQDISLDYVDKDVYLYIVEQRHLLFNNLKPIDPQRTSRNAGVTEVTVDTGMRKRKWPAVLSHDWPWSKP